MSLKHGILGLLSYSPMSGYDLMKYFNESINFFWSAQGSQIYRELDKLQRDEFIEVNRVIQEKRPNKKIFSITERGKGEFVRWVNEFSLKEINKTRDIITMKIFFGASADKEILINNLIKFKKSIEEEYKSLSQVKENLHKFQRNVDNKKESLFWDLTISKGLKSMRANMEWAEEAIGMIREY
ncbi:MAG: PadR family transcriptional regulator [Anaeromicrobium sp.]|uniref:PadR family transcriptional regulator n=1 Tax=Anaeromicrobium sp. TaxID=1929132 RepID=UPI0025E35289|nr:PadR family transcriptional regulator [Anaeromicrobium sp.]MCT4594130.1 PadR family transcriptional regulator [Anaeromicrobium sp.]